LERRVMRRDMIYKLGDCPTVGGARGGSQGGDDQLGRPSWRICFKHILFPK